MQQLAVGDTTFRWDEHGAGPPVVLIHGIPTSPALWRYVLPLCDRARLLAWEMPGYGTSWDQTPAGGIGVKAQAAHLLAWMDAIRIDRAVFVGHDLGGGVAQIAAVHAPERCAGLVLSNSISYDSWPIPSIRLMQRFTDKVRRLPAASLRPMFAMLMARGHDVPAIAYESGAIHTRCYEHPGAAEAFARQIASLDTSDTLEVADDLPRIDAPAVLVWGAADGFQRVEYADRLAAALDARRDYIPQGKHFVPEDHPDRIAAAIASVLELTAV